MKKASFGYIVPLLMIILFSYPVYGDETVVYRDKSGKYQGKSIQKGKTTTYRDRTGKYQGKSVKKGKKVEYRDRTGKKIGTATVK